MSPSGEGRQELEPERPGFAAPEGSYAVRLQNLATVTAKLSAADSVQAITEIVAGEVATTIGAAVSALLLRDRDTLDLVGAHGLPAQSEQRWASFSITDQTPAGEAVRTGQPVVVASSQQVEARYPPLRGSVPADRALVCLPLSGEDQPIGVIALTFDESWVPGPRELEFLTVFADVCAQAIRRIRAVEVAQEKARLLTFLSDSSVVLASSLDYGTTLTSVANLVVPTLADWCAVAVAGKDGALTTLAVAHVDPSKRAWAWELQERYPPDPHSPTGPPNVVRTGVSELYPEITDEMLVAGARDDEHLRLTRELNLRSAVVVPLSARGRTFGAITLIRSETGRPYGPEDLTALEDLGRRGGLAIDNSLLHQQTVDVARQLRRAVLPEDLSTIPGWEIATHSSPGGHAAVGGDFFDAVPLGPDRLVLFIGDVMGHGVAAAAAMAQMRSAIRAYLSIDPAPAVVVAKLDRMFAELAVSRLVTLVYVIIDAGAGAMEFVNAGHLPPLVVSRDGDGVGRQEFVEAATQAPLGTGGQLRVPTRRPMGPTDMLLLYTDGLVERRDEGVDVGLSRLSANATLLADAPLSQGLPELVRRVGSEASDDDVTVVAVRRSAAQP